MEDRFAPTTLQESISVAAVGRICAVGPMPRPLDLAMHVAGTFTVAPGAVGALWLNDC